MNILITGGAGFIGSTLADKLLTEGCKISVIDNFDNFYDVKLKEQNVALNLNNPNYSLYRGNICDTAFMDEIFKKEKFDVVIHLAGLAGVRPSFERPLDYIENNIKGSVNLLECMVKNKVKKIVFASSSSVYGNCKAKKFTEDLKLSKPISPYASTKLSCENILYTYSKIYNINTVCLRFFTVFGTRQRPDLAIRKFTELILKDEVIPVYGDGTAMRDYTYIDDIVSGICSSLEYNKTPYEIINLGNGHPITLNKMVETIEMALGKKAKIIKLPMQKGDVYKTVCDITKAKKLLNYSPKTDFISGIEKFVKNYK